MDTNQKKFVTDLYSKMLEGYFDLDDFKKAYSMITDNQDANVIRMRRTISSYVNMENLKGIDEPVAQPIPSTEIAPVVKPKGRPRKK